MEPERTRQNRTRTIDTQQFNKMVKKVAERMRNESNGEEPSDRRLADFLGFSSISQFFEIKNGQLSYQDPHLPILIRSILDEAGYGDIDMAGIFFESGAPAPLTLAEESSIRRRLNARKPRIEDTDIEVVATFLSPESAIRPEHIFCEVREERLAELPAGLEAHREARWERLLATARRKNLWLHENETFSVRECVDLRNGRGKERWHELLLRVIPCRFSQWYYPNKFFYDDELPKLLKLQNQLRLRFEDLKGERVPPWLAVRFGVGVAVVTRDDKVIVPIRSENVAEGPPDTYSCSVGETLYATDVLGNVAGLLGRKLSGRDPVEPSPVATAVRALRYELGLVPEDGHYDPKSLRLLAVTFTRSDVAASLIFFLKVDCTAKQVLECWETATDKNENQTILTPVWNARNALMLSKGQFQYSRSTYQQACRRERFGFLFARLYCGLDKV